jgi:hypothetical protein
MMVPTGREPFHPPIGGRGIGRRRPAEEVCQRRGEPGQPASAAHIAAFSAAGSLACPVVAVTGPRSAIGTPSAVIATTVPAPKVIVPASAGRPGNFPFGPDPRAIAGLPTAVPSG